MPTDARESKGRERSRASGKETRNGRVTSPTIKARKSMRANLENTRRKAAMLIKKTLRRKQRGLISKNTPPKATTRKSLLSQMPINRRAILTKRGKAATSSNRSRNSSKNSQQHQNSMQLTMK